MRDLNQEILVITSFLKVCNSEFELSFTENDIDKLFESKISYNDLNNSLNYLVENDILSCIRGAEDGFAESFNVTIKTEKCFDFIQSNYITYHTELLNTIEKQRKELKDIYGFLPDNIVQEINDSKSTLNDIINNIKDSDFLKALEPKVKEINDYLEKTEKVITNYENIYLNIIKPIKKEGKQGIRATAIWAILSIFLTTVLSFYFSSKVFNKPSSSNNFDSNLFAIQQSISNIPKTGIESKNGTDISILESKVNFLIREYVGLNQKFKVAKNNIEIKFVEKEIIFIAKADTVIAQSYAYMDFKTDTSCYSRAGLRFYINNRLITTKMLREVFILKSVLNKDNYKNNVLYVIEGDTIEFKDEKILIDKIFCEDSECLPVGDKYNAVRMKKINENNR